MVTSPTGGWFTAATGTSSLTSCSCNIENKTVKLTIAGAGEAAGYSTGTYSLVGTISVNGVAVKTFGGSYTYTSTSTIGFSWNLAGYF